MKLNLINRFTVNEQYAVLLVVFLLPGSILASCAYAASAGQQQCAGKADKERLECYDAYAAASNAAAAPPLETAAAAQRSYLTRSWDLDHRDDELLGDQQSPLRPHRTSYLIARKTGQPNERPNSPTHVATAASADIDLNEIKFQISQKGKILNPLKMNFLGFTGVRLWGAYTQQSNWQAFNAKNSSPFRETNYEPELILSFSTGNQYGLKLLNLAYAHQSNGRDLTGSRSWNRAYLQGGWETETVSVLVRRWWRIPEGDGLDDNPDIEDYYGRGDITLRWEPADSSQMVDLTLRNNLRSDQNRGFVQLDWAVPFAISKSTKLHIQFTSGYGESLIDYNFHQNTLGLGVSFRDW